MKRVIFIKFSFLSLLVPKWSSCETFVDALRSSYSKIEDNDYLSDYYFKVFLLEPVPNPFPSRDFPQPVSSRTFWSRIRTSHLYANSPGKNSSNTWVNFAQKKTEKKNCLRIYRVNLWEKVPSSSFPLIKRSTTRVVCCNRRSVLNPKWNRSSTKKLPSKITILVVILCNLGESVDDSNTGQLS
jgi:hypothetical protein